ncbi:uncharacterized protein LOC121726882 [Aricia agestis]|uniref:uncharacterized protein LOC121726882 n=1 Tax=Aricia agestis TaxID=91739 RepID=UPI001C206BBA|nr:uncharacterized protein LOC121726882 [Aricia agestis]
MIFVIVFVVVYCNLQLQSECAPLKENIMKIKFPRPVVHASSVNISGTLNVRATMLRATIKGNELGNEECPIEIKPQEDIIVIGGSDVPYEFFIGDKEVIPFTLTIRAWSNPDENVDSLHLEFNGNEAGMQALEFPCKFKSFKSVDRIFVEGFKHIRRLTFEYEDEDDDDYA